MFVDLCTTVPGGQSGLLGCSRSPSTAFLRLPLWGDLQPIRREIGPCGALETLQRAHICILLLPTVQALGRHLPMYSSFNVEFLAASRTPNPVSQCDHR
jgi:hypothetical protein